MSNGPACICPNGGELMPAPCAPFVGRIETTRADGSVRRKKFTLEGAGEMSFQSFDCPVHFPNGRPA